MAWLMHTSTHGSCGYQHTTKPGKIPVRTGEGPSRPESQQKSYGQLAVAELSRIFLLWRCGHGQIVRASVDGHISMCIWVVQFALRRLLITKKIFVRVHEAVREKRLVALWELEVEVDEHD